MDDNTNIDQFNIILGPEIFIGLVGPLGSDLSVVTAELETSFSRLNYETIVIRLSEFIDEIKGDLDTPLVASPENERISSYMDAGTELREKLGWCSCNYGGRKSSREKRRT